MDANTPIPDIPGISARPIANPQRTQDAGTAPSNFQDSAQHKVPDLMPSPPATVELTPGTSKYYIALIRQARDGVDEALRCVRTSIAHTREAVDRSAYRLGAFEELYSLECDGRATEIFGEPRPRRQRQQTETSGAGSISETSLEYDYEKDYYTDEDGKGDGTESSGGALLEPEAGQSVWEHEIDGDPDGEASEFNGTSD